MPYNIQTVNTRIATTFLIIELCSCYTYNVIRLNLSSYMNVLLLSASGKSEWVLCGRRWGREKGQKDLLEFRRLDYLFPKQRNDVTQCGLGPPESLLPLKGDGYTSLFSACSLVSGLAHTSLDRKPI